MRLGAAGVESRLLAVAGLGFLTILVGGLLILHLDPIVVLILCVGTATIATLVFNPMIGVHVFIALLYFENALVTREGFTAMQVIGPFILAAWMMNVLLRRRSPFRLDAFILTMVAFLVWCALSLLYAHDTGAALGRLATFVQLAIMTLMFISVVDDEKKLTSVLWAMVTWTSIASVAGLATYQLGITKMVTGPGENRNTFALLLVIAIVCAFLLGDRTRTPGVRMLLRFVLLPLFLVALALALSRAGYICLVVAWVILWYRMSRARRAWPAIAMVAGIALLLPFLPEAFWDRAKSILPVVTRQEDTFGKRLDVWELGLKMIKDRPMLGVGVGNFMHVFARYAHGRMVRIPIAAHNSYVGVSAETGLVGLALFLLLHARSLQSAQRAFRAGRRLDRPDLQVLATAVEASIVVLMVGGLSGNTETMKCLWVLFAMASSLGTVAKRFETAPAVSSAKRAEPGA